MRVLVILLALLFVAPATAHHGDTPESAESPPVGPVTLYHHYLLVGQELERLASDHPDKMTYEVIGNSVLGLDIYGVQITNFEGGEDPIDDRPRMYFDGSIHSNEQLGMELAMDIIRWLVEDYDVDPIAQMAVDTRNTFIVPLVNPDGNIRDSRQNANSVDLNRNFPAGWGGPGSSARGPSPLSEPETQAVAAYLEQVRPVYSNSFHTGTVMLLFPYGNYERGTNITSPDHDMFSAICADIGPVMDEMYGRAVPCGQVFSTIYPASGTTVDYVYERFGAASFTYEVDNEQNLYWSVEPIRQRLGPAWVSVQHAYENVERYGALLDVAKLEVEIEDARADITVHLRNTGMGGSNNTEVRLGDVVVPVESVPAGMTVPVKFDVKLVPDTVMTLQVAYNKTFYKGVYEVREGFIQVDADGSVTASGSELVRSMEVSQSGGMDIPAISVLLPLVGLLALVGVRRRLS